MHERLEALMHVPHQGLLITRCFHFKGRRDCSDVQASDALEAVLAGFVSYSLFGLFITG